MVYFSGELRWFHKLQWILLNVTFDSAFVTTVIFWAFINSRQQYPEISIHHHVISSVLSLIEIFVCHLPIRILHFVYPLLYGFIYILFTLILHATGEQSEFYKNLLNWGSKPGLSAGVVIGILALSVLMHSFAFGLYHLRALIARKCGVEENNLCLKKSNESTRSQGSVNEGFEMRNTV